MNDLLRAASGRRRSEGLQSPEVLGSEFAPGKRPGQGE